MMDLIQDGNTATIITQHVETFDKCELPWSITHFPVFQNIINHLFTTLSYNIIIFQFVFSL